MHHRDQDTELHLRLLAHDPTVPAEVCEIHLSPLVHTLTRRHPRICPLLIEQAVHDALIDYFKDPGQYDPGRSPLRCYLLMVARRDLSNGRRAEARHQRNRVDPVELAELQGNQKRGASPVDQLIQDEESAFWLDRVDRVRASCTLEEQAVLDLLLQAERSTQRYAEVLGVTFLPREQQERAVKRVKDRLKKRLQRGADHGSAGGVGGTNTAGPAFPRLVAGSQRASRSARR